MKESEAKRTHRDINRYHCPPFFEARVCGATLIEEQAKVEDISIRGLSIRTCCEFSPGSDVEIELKSNYLHPVKLQARVRWVAPVEGSGSSRLVGCSIRKVGVIEWFRYMRVLSHLKKELW